MIKEKYIYIFCCLSVKIKFRSMKEKNPEKITCLYRYEKNKKNNLEKCLYERILNKKMKNSMTTRKEEKDLVRFSIFIYINNFYLLIKVPILLLFLLFFLSLSLAIYYKLFINPHGKFNKRTLYTFKKFSSPKKEKRLIKNIFFCCLLSLFPVFRFMKKKMNEIK